MEVESGFEMRFLSNNQIICIAIKIFLFFQYNIKTIVLCLDHDKIIQNISHLTTGSMPIT